MAAFEDHINQSRKNLRFLVDINQKIDDCNDWQVTVCFYSALHLMNAHLSKFSLQYRKHKDVNIALNFATLSPAKLPADEYVAYTSLQSLSRRSRYLVNEKDRQISSLRPFQTYEKHLGKALRHLDKIIDYFEKKYKIKFPKLKITCETIKKDELKYFEVLS